MKIQVDIETLVASARANGRAALTVSQYQRLNLFYDRCVGWLLTCMPMPDFSGALSKKLDESRELQVRFAASMVEMAIQAGGEEGRFGDPCVVTTPGGDIYAFHWSVLQ